MSKHLAPAAFGLALVAAACASSATVEVEADSYVMPVYEELGPIEIDRVTTAVPWPRGVRFIDGQLYALARGVHRSAGGPQEHIEDHAGSIFVIDPGVGEDALADAPVGAGVRTNGQIIAAPEEQPFRLWNRQMPATLDIYTDRPYCMLVWDEPSQNFFVCGYSGIDIPEQPLFRKNATDSVHRYDLRNGLRSVVEAHDPDVVPAEELAVDVDSRYYPHHDPATNAAPHGLVNGPCGAVVAGDYLYVGGKDNTALAQYDLHEIRENPDAPAPDARYVFEGSQGYVMVDTVHHGQMQVNGTAAMTVHEGYLYVAFRTTSQIIRFPLEENGDLVRPLKAEYIAQFARYDTGRPGRSANIYDMAFDSEGRLYVSPGYDGAVYRFWPDPERVYDTLNVDYEPYIDLEPLVGAKKSGNICFDNQDNLYICSGQQVLDDSEIRGVIYKVAKR
ncbi:MAG: hypothetical protein AAFZ65_06245 [Planctomycetota bacterium]